MFHVARFIADCEAAIATDRGRDAVRDVLATAISDPAGLIAVFGEPKRAGVQALHRSPRLTILHLAWPPSFTQKPHNHLLWSEIGVYSGREDNIFWHRCAPHAKWPLEAAGAASVCTGSCLSLEAEAIHSVTNPLDRVTVGLHVYGGDLCPGAPRSAWDSDTLVEGPFDHLKEARAAEAYNTRLLDERALPQQLGLNDDELRKSLKL
jgi:predicted metal-dependent enzyme (double-stranded beta helix superfamily)